MTDDPRWGEVDAFIGGHLLGADAALEAALVASAEAGLPDIAVSPPQGRLLTLLAKLVGARRILEIGTLGGYSTICLARGLAEGGTLVSLEIDPQAAAVARANIARAGLADRVEVRVGAALDLLPDLQGPFDLAFIDADKVNNPGYFDHAVRLARPGALILVDNVVRGGSIVDAAADDASIVGTRALYEAVSGDRRVETTAIQTVGSKGWDGLLLARVR